ncbi:MAG: TetR/AcrR family transcriptional regulator [Candidatus Riflebacteria bacterium]|nr:TetR/AcrR family transcriptional regulator [Candidatus Riflebacteria bacterium]
MGQTRKREVEEAIQEAALEAFARLGFAGASMERIAAAAGISTGNIYRYFPGKEALFDALLPDAVVSQVRRLVRRRMEALAQVEDVRTLPPTAAFHAASEELFTFARREGRRLVILLGGAQGTRLEHFPEDLTAMMIRGTCRHFRAIAGTRPPTPSLRFALGHIYRTLIAVSREALLSHPDPAEARQAIEEYLRYHLAGLNALFRR